MSQPAVVVRDLHVRFGDVEAVSGVDLSADSDQWAGFSGAERDIVFFALSSLMVAAFGVGFITPVLLVFLQMLGVLQQAKG